MVIVSQEGPLSIKRVDVSVSQPSTSVPLLSRSYKVPQEAKLPTTIAVVSNGDPTAQATISITGWEAAADGGYVALDRRDAFVTQIPADRVAEFKVVLTARCRNRVDGDGESTCHPSGYTCDSTTGDCIPREVAASDLPTYQAGDEYAGAGGSLAQGGSAGKAGDDGRGGTGGGAGSPDEAGASGEGGSAPIAGKPSGGSHSGGDGGKGTVGGTAGTGATAGGDEGGVAGMGGAGALGGGGGAAGGAGTPGCAIDAMTFGNGDKNPANACLYCDSMNSPSAWAKATDGTDCDTGKVCNSGSCASGCFVNGTFYDSGVGQPNNVICQSCVPSKSTSKWTQALDGTECASAQVCNAGVCKPGCGIGGTYYTSGQGQPGNTTCETCKPTTSTSAWTAASEGTVCNSNQFCHTGACAQGCFIGGTFYAAGAVNGCQSCQPGKSTTSWTNADGIVCAGGGTCCSNTCVNLQTSNTHCGGCGLACSSACSAGECVVQMCSSLGGVSGFTAVGIDANNVYATHTSSSAAALSWVSTDGSCTPGSEWGSTEGVYETVDSISVTSSGVAFSATGPPYPSPQMRYIVPGKGKSVKVGTMKATAVPITSDASNVYWLDYASGAGNVVKAPISGAGPTTQLGPISAAGGIAIDATYVYWADSNSVKRVPIATGTMTTLVSGLGSPGPLSVDSANLYYTGASNALFRLPLGTTTSTQLMNGGATFALTAFGPNTFYWADKKTINSISLVGGAVGTASVSPVKVLYTVPTGQSITALGVSGRSLYWVAVSSNSNPVLMKLTPN